MMSRDHTIEDYLSYRIISDAGLTSDNLFLFFSTSRTFKEKGKTMEGSVVVQSLKDSSIKVELQETGSKNYSPSVNTSGKRLAYLQERDKQHSLVICGLDGGNPERILLEGNARKVSWVDDNSLMILMSDPEEEVIRKERETGNDGYFFEEGLKFSSIYVYTPGYGFRRITDGIQVWEYDLVGNTVAFVGSEDPTESSWYHSKIYIQGIDGGSRREVYSPSWWTVAKPRLSGDGRKVAFLESLWSDRGVTSGDIVVANIEDGRTTNITEGHDRSYCDVRWSPDGGIVALWTREGSAGFSTYLEEWKDMWSSPGTVFPTSSPEFWLSGATMVFSFTDAETPLEVFMLDSGHMKKLTGVNSSLQDLTSYRTEIVKWKSSDGLEMYGILRYKNNQDPLIVNVHGGPTGFSPVTFLDRSTPFIPGGYSIFYPNYRGSIGKGRSFAEANRGDMGGKDLQDILSGIEYLRKSGKVKTESVFITGGSYGGFMTSWAVTQTDIFTAAVGLFGITDWISFHGVTNIPAWDAIHYNQSPYSRDLFEKFSPLNYLDKVKTPILLQHGIEDPCVPVGQYLQFYRGLKDKGKTVRLILYPREGHGFLERKHIIMQFEESLRWFDRYRSR